MVFFISQASVKFPPKNSIRHVLSQIRGSEEFLLERFNFMKEYLDCVSSNAELRFNRAFLKIYRHLQQNKNKAEKVNSAERAPVIKGRRLQSKEQPQGQLYIIV
jgi:hypothetical protein